MRKFTYSLIFALTTICAYAQGNGVVLTNAGAPSGGCAFVMFYINKTTGEFYNCKLGSWQLVGPGAAGAASWSSLSNPTGNLPLTMAALTSTFTWNATTGAAADMFTFADTLNNTGTGYILRVNLASGSAAKPFSAAVNGNGVSVSNTGVLAKLGTGQVNADHYNGNALVAVADGGTGLATLAAHQIYLGNGTSAPTPIPSGTNGQLLQSLGAGVDPGFADPIVSGPDAVGATATKNPVQAGCLFNTTPATITNGQVGAAQCDSVQNILVNLKTALPAGSNVIGHVVADSGSTTAVTGNVAVTKADGSDVTLGAKADAKSTATDTTPITIMSVLKQISASVQAPPSQAVTNAGTFADQATLQTQTDTTMVGGVNVKEINGVAPLMGNGNTGTGSQRVTIAADNTAFAVNATLSAETTKVIGTVRTQGNVGGVMDAVIGAAAPANVLAAGLKDTSGNSQAALSDTNGRAIVKLYPDTTTTSYHASKKFAASSTTDVAVMPGNATNKVILDKVTLTCTQTTAGQINVELVKRSAADTSGTSASITAVPDYSSYAAAVSAPLSYTGTGPTVGAAVGDLDNAQIGCMAAATATPNDVYVFRPAKPIILNGTAEQVAINLGGALTGGNITVTFDWRETTTP